MDCSGICSKLLSSILFLSNVVFAVTGFFLIAIGVAVKNYYTQYEAFLDDKYFSASTLLIATGSIVFIVAFLGCWGACKQNRFMIMGYSTILTLLLILEFASGVTAYVLSSQTTELLNDKVNQSMYKYTTQYDIAYLWDTVQHQFECCGLNNYTDWQQVFNNASLPVSCCAFETGSLDSIVCNTTSKELYRDPCRDKVASDVKEHTMMLGGVAFSILGLQFLGILGSCYLSKYIKTMNYETV